MASLVLFSSHLAPVPQMSSPLQEADVVGISSLYQVECHGKGYCRVASPHKRSLEIATSGRPGPVLVDLPKDVTAGVLRRAIPTTSALPGLPSAASRATMGVTQRHHERSLSRVADLINIAKRLVIYAG